MEKTFYKIIKKLKKSGFKAYLVGGSVRDLILGLNPKDFDIVSDATPNQIKKIFKNTKSVGQEFGVTLVIEDKQIFEVATFRSDSMYSDQRRPDKVSWSSPKEDAKRRDFTINALFFDLKIGAKLKPPIKINEVQDQQDRVELKTNLGLIIDYVGGIIDLERKVLRFVGSAEERILEDHLRILRAIRFKSVFVLDYFAQTFNTLKKNINKIKDVSNERIRDELDKMLQSEKRINAVKELDEVGALKIILPELEPLKTIEQSKKFFQTGNIFDHTLLVLSSLPKEIEANIVWAALLHDIGKPQTLSMGYDRKKRWTEKFHNHNVVSAEITKKILKRLKFPNDRIERICWLVENHQMPPQILSMREGRKRRWLLDSRLPDLLELHRADAMGKERKVYLGWYDEVKKLMEEELQKPPPPPKLLDGHEIMKKYKLKPGPEIGRLLDIVEDAQWDKKISTKEEALKLVKNNM